MRMVIVIGLLLGCCRSRGEDCATSYTDLGKTQGLRSIQLLFDLNARLDLVNETKGSYVTIESQPDGLKIIFYTSGLFDLYPIRREGPVIFCDSGEAMTMSGLGLSEKLSAANSKITLGDGGPKKVFSKGPMPELLRRLHRIDERGLAAVQGR